jgi:tRNA threonylcarbamoyladenosine biosynthesis protein TsaE
VRGIRFHATFLYVIFAPGKHLFRMSETSAGILEFEIKKPEELVAVARAVLSLGAHTVLLKGDLGTGKTTFVKCICRLLGSADEVTSPTFTLVNEYRDAAGDPIFHIDLYRLQTLDEVLQIGIEEYLHSGAWCFIEWPEIMIPLVSGSFVEVTLEILPGGSRRIRILK